MPRLLPSILVLVACAPLVPAQITNTQVVPPSYTNLEANSLDREPFGYDQIRSVQYIDRTLLSGIPANTLLKEIAYRRDGGLTGVPTMTRTRVLPPNWQIRLGKFSGNYATVSPSFPAVSDVNYTVVYAAKPTSFPNLTLVNGGGPQNFDLKFPLDLPWQFSSPGIAIDHYCYETTNVGTYAYYVDTIDPNGNAGHAGLITPQSVGCPLNQNRAAGQSTNPGTGDLVLSLFGAQGGKAAIACIGASATQWGSIALPFDLGVLGLAGCKVYTDLTVQVVLTSASSGTAELRVPVPANAFLAGATVYGQWLVQDNRVNPNFPYATSDGIAFKLGDAVPVAMSVNTGQGQIANGGTGFVVVGHGHVVRFGW